jgi:hypothetical protein
VFLAAANDLRTRSHRELLDDSVARRTRAVAFRRHAFAIALAQQQGVPAVSFVVPGVASSAVDYLLAHRAATTPR